jgi:hypothetical protein
MAARSLILTDLLKNKSMITKGFCIRQPEAHVLWIGSFKSKIWDKKQDLTQFYQETGGRVLIVKYDVGLLSL